jgi:hypothetical protein
VIPRQSHVPLHVSVEGEQVARFVEVDAERIAQPAGHQFPRATVAIGANQMTERHLGAGVEEMLVPFTRQQMVLSVMAEGGVRRNTIGGQSHVVAVDAVDHSVRTERELVAPMADAAGRGLEQLDFIELIVAVRVAKAIEALRVVRIRVEGVVSEQQAATFQQVGVDGLDAPGGGNGARAAVGVGRETKQPPVFAGDHDSPPRIESHRHPRALARLRGTNQFDGEARQRGEVLRGCGRVRSEGALPLVVIRLDRHGGPGMQRQHGAAQCDGWDGFHGAMLIKLSPQTRAKLFAFPQPTTESAISDRTSAASQIALSSVASARHDRHC